MKFSQKTVAIHRKNTSTTISCCCWSRLFRQKTKCTVLCLQVTILIWAFGVFLLNVMKEETPIVRQKVQQRSFETGSGDRKQLRLWKKRSVQEMSDVKKIKIYLESIRINPSPFLTPVDYNKIVRGDEDTISKATYLFLDLLGKNYTAVRKNIQDDRALMDLMKNCTNFILKRAYITRTMSIEEKLYPIAYVIAVHKKLATFERLLRAIYHPQNIYCIHVDKKSPPSFLNGIRNLSQCFRNVFIASSLVGVRYSHWSRVQADLNCLKDLIEKKSQVPWKYVINLCGQDFPLKTNLEITRALKSFHGYNNIESVTPPKSKKKRYNFHHEFPPNVSYEYATLKTTKLKKSEPPLDIFVGSAYYTWKRQAVEFMLTNSTVREFLDWSKDTFSPDEHVWATLQRWYPQMPGSRPPHKKYDLNELQTVARLVKWKGVTVGVYPKCGGRYIRGVCVYGVSDVHWLLQQHHIFANKFDLEIDPFAIDCLDVWLRNRTISQTFQTITTNQLLV